MLNFLKKKKFKDQDYISYTDIPSAQEMLKKSEENWPIIDLENIFKKIEYKSALGYREAVFYNSTISLKTIALFEIRGYKVKTDTLDGCPYFEIHW